MESYDRYAQEYTPSRDRSLLSPVPPSPSSAHPMRTGKAETMALAYSSCSSRLARMELMWLKSSSSTLIAYSWCCCIMFE